ALFLFSSRRRHTRCYRDWSSDVCSSDLTPVHGLRLALEAQEGPRSASFWWGYARRQRWPAWGFTGNPEFGPDTIGFQRYGAELRSEERRVGKECRGRRWRSVCERSGRGR